jgi:hypothetical protein
MGKPHKYNKLIKILDNDLYEAIQEYWYDIDNYDWEDEYIDYHIDPLLGYVDPTSGRMVWWRKDYHNGIILTIGKMKYYGIDYELFYDKAKKRDRKIDYFLEMVDVNK